jgi:mono/diheme cytochrome c family protein
MKSFRRFALILVVAGSIIYTVSSTFAASKKTEGADIYREKCSMCHGIDGKGYAAIKTPDFTDAKWQAAHSDKEMLDAIEKGVQGTAMVSFKGKLNDQQMKDVLKYIRLLGGKEKK